MPIALELDQGRVPVKVWTPDLEATARRQLENVAQLPIVHSHVAAMPDVHAGIGATDGSVITTKGAIIPAAVGVDLGCGVNAVQLSLTAEDLPQSLRAIRSAAGGGCTRARAATATSSAVITSSARAAKWRGRTCTCPIATLRGSRKARRPSTLLSMRCTGRRTMRSPIGAR